MPRLGSVLGAILAELVRARSIADHISRELVDEYRGDPILASMSVPRVLLDQFELTLRFSVSDLEEAEVTRPTPSVVADRWSHHVAASVLPRVLERHGLAPDERAEVAERLAGRPATPAVRPPIAAIRAALAGESSEAARGTAEAILEGWSDLPSDVRARLGTKTVFRKELEVLFEDDLGTFVDRAQELEVVRAALASIINVGIRPAELPTEPEKIQELRLTLRGEDVSLIIESAGEEI